MTYSPSVSSNELYQQRCKNNLKNIHVHMTILTVLFTDLPRLLGLGRKKIITDKHNPRRTFWFKNVLISLLTDL